MMRAAELPLPTCRHVPGVYERPAESFFEAVKQATPVETHCAAGRDNPAWLYGLRLLNAGFYWEAHEVLEPVWLNAAPNSRERYLVQAVIHLANGMLKDAMGRPNARQRLAELSHEAFAAAFPSGDGVLMGIDAKTALHAAAQLADGRAGISLSAYSEI